MSAPSFRPNLGGAAVALIFLAVGAYAVWTSLSMTMLGAIFPRTIGAILIGLSMIQVVRALAGRGGQRSGESAEASNEEGLVRRLGLVLVMVAWAIVFPLVGFVATSLVAAIALVFLAEHENTPVAIWILRIAVVSAMVMAFYWLMTRVLYIPMPRGLLF